MAFGSGDIVFYHGLDSRIPRGPGYIAAQGTLLKGYFVQFDIGVSPAPKATVSEHYIQGTQLRKFPLFPPYLDVASRRTCSWAVCSWRPKQEQA